MNDRLACYIVGVLLGTALGASAHSLYVSVKEREQYELGKTIGKMEGISECISIVHEVNKEKESE